jgi:diguanylate cyclase (GGDEF)-like protein
MPTSADVEDEQLRRAEDAGVSDVATEVSVYDSLMSIDAVGPHITVLAAAPANIVDGGTTHSVKATTLLPANVPVGGYSDDQGLRQTSAAVTGAANVFVSAVAPADVSLPGEEFRFYVIIFSLAVMLLLLAGVTLVVEQRSLLERASFDSLTKLPNRGEFERRAADVLATADRNESGVCLLLFDLNGFKQVNDTHGHDTGDRLLVEVAQRLRRVLRASDQVARIGGDEFVVVLEDVPGLPAVEQVARKLIAEIGKPCAILPAGGACGVTTSVGVSLFPADADTSRELLQHADAAMYRAKQESKNDLRFYAPP